MADCSCECALPSTGELARNRAALYHWFALAFFQPPSDEDVYSQRDGAMWVLLQSLEATPAAGDGVAAMKRALTAGTPSNAASALGAAYTRIFDGAGGHAIAPPYRSVYDSAGGLLCQQATAEMDRVLRQHRMRLDDKVHEPADHLSIQLEVMSQLALRVAEEAELQSRPLPPLFAEQADFLTNQLLAWVRRFAERVAAVNTSGYYAGLASVLVAFLDQDRAYLTET
ncbi:MAG: molecular chaperone TorD family protein [Propionivibrio sp.]